jgi:methyl-accepting chemotaxis protein
LSVKQRLYALVGALLALWLLSAGVAIVGLNQARAGSQELAASFDDANLGSEAYTAWLSEDGAVNMAVLIQALNDPTQAELADETWQVAADSHAAALDAMKQLEASTSPELVSLAQAASKALADYEAYVDQVKAAVEAGDLPLATKVQTVDNYPASTATVEAFDTMNKVSDERVAQIVSQVDATVARWTIVLIVLLVIGVAVAIVLTARIIGSIMKPLNAIDVALGSLAAGDLSARVAVKGDDELSRVGTSLNKAAEAQQQSVAAIADNAQMLAAAAEQLTATSNLMSTSAEATSNQASEVAQRSESVNENVQTAATATDELTASIAQISSSAWDAARVASTAVEVAGNTSLIMSKLEVSSSDIEKVIKEIKGVADQTNLLALNATIESARAGEAGKGFAVVASEVKDLARATATATTDITQKIQTITTDTAEAIAAIQEITSTITQINEIQHSIASAVEEQTAAINEIARSMSDVTIGSGQIAQNIEGVTEAAQSASSGAAQTRQAAGELAHMASSLEGLVGTFRF